MAAATGNMRADTRRLLVTVFRPESDIPVIKGVWDKKTGGQLDSEETLYHPGAMADPESLGGRVTPENITLQRLCKIGRDWRAIPSLMNGVGKSRVTIVDEPMTLEGRTDPADGLVYAGTLKRVTPPPADSESSDAALIEIEITIDTWPG